MTTEEFDIAMAKLDNLFDNGEISQKEWSIQYQLLRDEYSSYEK